MDDDRRAGFEARLARSLDRLNRGELDETLSRYADDVVVLIPAAKPGDPVRETMLYGRPGFRDCVFRYVATLSPLRARSVDLDGPSRVVATFKCRGGRMMTYEVEFDRAGLGKRVRISLTEAPASES
jgi:hypothetical protein